MRYSRCKAAKKQKNNGIDRDRKDTVAIKVDLAGVEDRCVLKTGWGVQFYFVDDVDLTGGLNQGCVGGGVATRSVKLAAELRTSEGGRL